MAGALPPLLYLSHGEVKGKSAIHFFKKDEGWLSHLIPWHVPPLAIKARGETTRKEKAHLIFSSLYQLSKQYLLLVLFKHHHLTDFHRPSEVVIRKVSSNNLSSIEIGGVDDIISADQFFDF